MTSHRARLWLLAVMFCLSLAVWLLFTWPIPRVRETIPLPALVLPVPEAGFVWQQRMG